MILHVQIGIATALWAVVLQVYIHRNGP